MKNFNDYLETINEGKKGKTQVPSKNRAKSFSNVKTQFKNITDQAYNEINSAFNKIKKNNDVKLYLNSLIKVFNEKHEDIEDFKDFKDLFIFFKFEDEKSDILNKTLDLMIMFNTYPGKNLETNKKYNLSDDIIEHLISKDVKDFINAILKKN